MFTYKTSVKLHHTDAAGVLFFAHQFQLIHDAYEAMLEANGAPYADFFKGAYALPIVHAETNYREPLRVSDKVSIEIHVDHIGQSSFTLKHVLKRQGSDQIVGDGKTVHVAVDYKKIVKIDLPETIRALLQKV